MSCSYDMSTYAASPLQSANTVHMMIGTTYYALITALTVPSSCTPVHLKAVIACKLWLTVTHTSAYVFTTYSIALLYTVQRTHEYHIRSSSVLLTIARYFSVTLEQPVATHTAIHTIQLHTIPRKNVVMNGCYRVQL
jgi:hypothetical protein